MNLAWIGQKFGPALAHSQWLIWPLLLGCLVLGVIALVSPDRFRAIAANGGRWVDTNKLFQKLDTPVNIDQTVLRHARLFGLAILAASLFLAYIFVQRFASGGRFWF